MSASQNSGFVQGLEPEVADRVGVGDRRIRLGDRRIRFGAGVGGHTAVGERAERDNGVSVLVCDDRHWHGRGGAEARSAADELVHPGHEVSDVAVIATVAGAAGVGAAD